jgi:hypothetical protein
LSPPPPPPPGVSTSWSSGSSCMANQSSPAMLLTVRPSAYSTPRSSRVFGGRAGSVPGHHVEDAVVQARSHLSQSHCEPEGQAGGVGVHACDAHRHVVGPTQDGGEGHRRGDFVVGLGHPPLHPQHRFGVRLLAVLERRPHELHGLILPLRAPRVTPRASGGSGCRTPVDPSGGQQPDRQGRHGGEASRADRQPEAAAMCVSPRPSTPTLRNGFGPENLFR